MKIKIYSFICSILILFLLLSIPTLIFRNDYRRTEVRTDIFDGYRELFLYGLAPIENILNILLFIPVGLVLSHLFIKNRLFIIILFGFCFSLIIETLQYYLKRGIFDYSDLLNNTFGAFLGFAIYIIIINCFEKEL